MLQQDAVPAQALAGQLEFRLERVASPEALSELEALVLPQVRAKALAYDVACATEGAPPVAHADRDKLQQVVLNLLSNAIKATPPGGRVRLECDRDERTGGVVVRVSDTGTGIPPEKLESIFDPFVQVDRKLNRPSEGVGLGLAISRDLARAMAGDLTATSEVGRGSTFTLWLPARSGASGRDPHRGHGGGAPNIYIRDHRFPRKRVPSRPLPPLAHSFHGMAASDGSTGDGAPTGRAVDVPDGLDAALAPLYANVSSRLRGACAHMAPADFHALVLDIARMKLRWSGEHPAVAPSMGPVGESRGDASRQGARDGGQRS